MMRDDYNYRFKLTDYTQLDRNRKRKVAVYGRVSTEHEAQVSSQLGDSGPVYRRGHYRYPGQEKALLSADD